jgi:hypothetical protein
MSKKNKFLLVFSYVGFLAFLLEGSARLVFLIPQVSKRLRVDEDYMWRRDWIRRHQNSEVEIYYKFDIYDPSKGWKSKPNLRDMKIFPNQYFPGFQAA